MDWKKILRRKTQEEILKDKQDQLEKLKLDAEIEKQKAEIRECKARSKSSGGGYNPDRRHINFLDI